MMGVCIGTPGMTVPILFDRSLARMGDNLPSIMKAMDLPPVKRMSDATIG